MKKIFIFLAVLFQILVLAYMAGNREYILKTGKTVYLRSAPVDPRDIFRGDYVRLNYAISAIPVHALRGELVEHHPRGSKVYTVLKEGENGLAVLDYATDQKPENALFIKGRVKQDRRFGPWNRAIPVKYGIEAYFVQQGKGIEIEKRRGGRNDIQVPLEMEVALGHGGTGVIKGYRWETLGIGLKILRRPEGENPPFRSASVRLILMNASDETLGLVNLPDFHSFSLVPVLWAQKEWVLARTLSEPPPPTDENVILLKPQEQRSFDFDFSDDRWFVKADGKPAEIGTLEWSELFRLVYAPPSDEACKIMTDRYLIWHGELPSRAFHGRGNMD